MKLPDHPWESLTIKNGKIIREIDTLPDCEYLNTPAIAIINKKRAVPVEGKADVRYEFSLNSSVDPFWLGFLDDELRNIPSGMNRADLLVNISGSDLVLTCQPCNLDSKYPFIKECIERVNQRYDEYRVKIRNSVADLDLGKKKAAESKLSRNEQVLKQFNDFKI